LTILALCRILQIEQVFYTTVQGLVPKPALRTRRCEAAGARFDALERSVIGCGEWRAAHLRPLT
jgi:hypothetical protein